jgi:polar amino acid transport system substrate-binding protein
MTGDRAMARVASLLVALWALYAALSVAAGADAVPAEARVQLAPTGKLRVALVMFEPALATRDAAGEPVGVAPDLARALAGRLGVPLEPILFDSPATYAASADSFRWDIALAGREAGGGARVDFGPTFLLIDHEMLLPPGKTFRDLADIDREKVRVGVTIGTVDDQILARGLKKAVIFRVLIGTDNASLTLRNSGADAFAASVPFLAKVAAEVPGSRLLTPPFAVVPAVIAVSPGRTAALAYLADFVREAKASGLIQQSIDRAGLLGVRVAPP